MPSPRGDARLHADHVGANLGSVPPGLADLPMHRVLELTPAAWAASRK